MELWQLWLLATLDGWNGAITGLAFLSGCATFIGCMAYFIFNEEIGEFRKTTKRIIIICPTIMVVFILLSAAIPSTKGAMMIVGGYFATNLEGVENLPPNIVKAANKFLEQYSDPTE